MLTIRKSFKIGVHPEEKEAVRLKLVEMGASILSIRLFKTEANGFPLTKTYIDGNICSDKVEDLIEWLENNLSKPASITL